MFDDKILNSVKEIIKNSNDEIYLVGGYLRNYFINNEISNDKDFVVLKDSFNFAKDIANRLDGTFIELDKINKIYRVVLKDKINYFDISLALDNDIIEDSKRRDFTINSIYYDFKKEEIFDPLNGINDIKNKIIKTTNVQNFIDDPLRLLRMYRFYSITGFDIDKKLNDFVIEKFNLIKNIAKERINYEIVQIFSSKYLVKTLLKMHEDNTLETVFPFVKEIKKVPKNYHHHLDLIHHSIETVNKIETDSPYLKLAAFYHDIGKPSTWTIDEDKRERFIGHDIKGAELAKSELAQLNFSNKQINYISKMIKYHMYPPALIEASENKKAFARFIRKIENDTEDLIKLARADRLSALGEGVSEDMVNSTLKHLDNLLNYYYEAKKQTKDFKPLLNGDEIMKILNLKPSKKIGEILNSLKDAQLSFEIKTKEEAIEFIKNIK